MTPAELLRIPPALAAPAFFLFFGLAALGAPLLAVICLSAGQMRGTQHPEAYARRLLRLALPCALTASLVFACATSLALLRVSWLLDWLSAAPLVPVLLALAMAAYCVSLLVLRLSRTTRRSRPERPLPQAAALSALAVAILWLALSLLRDLAAQAQAVLGAVPVAGADGLSLAPLLPPDLTSTEPLLLAAVLAGALASAMCAGAWSLEYLLLRRDREPFGREAFAHALRLAARSSLRSGLLALSFLPALWGRLTDLPGPAPDAQAVQALLLACGAAILTACGLWLLLARSKRPHLHTGLVHGSLAFVWLGLTAALSAALLHFYA